MGIAAADGGRGGGEEEQKNGRERTFRSGASERPCEEREREKVGRLLTLIADGGGRTLATLSSKEPRPHCLCQSQQVRPRPLQLER